MSVPAPHHNHATCTAELLARAERACERRGSRLTGQRREMLNCVAESHSAVGAYDIIERMARHGPRPAPITVYRALDFLEAHGLVHRIESRNAFIACTHPHEGKPAAMLVCERCRLVAELDAPEMFGALQSAAKARGFEVHRSVVELTGLCAACQEAR
ncbi:transcriptional repressor [Aestuariivirga sp.]|uniref:transcriptional repressor n=1 Tax=Aestuariivirga sp. TaxID=2650926 RepID=UPI0025BE6444|nr:transcriptional repressor [Aestuariivirga sp.]MCA3556337.1 transcriptional repressor [Aestuariivirga sp.]